MFPVLSALGEAQDGVFRLVRKNIPVFLDYGLFLSFFVRSLICLGNTFLLEVSLVCEAVWARGMIEWDDEVMSSEAEHFTLVVGFPAREESGKQHDIFTSIIHLFHHLEELHDEF